MALIPGTRLGAYEVTARIGEGGMGEVYQATDTNLARQVAIKVLPEAVAADADRVARFDREARTLAALNHPNIAQIYGLERSDGTLALVMELVEGPTLADRVARGALPLDEALPIARQVAEALEAAHEQGIVHRDLKPANVKVRADGTVKVLDFGLAKAMEPAAASRASAAHTPSMAPTITTPAMTQAGMILGTAAYMSPEQARGQVVGRATDIWAWGCVLFEMLAGRRAFDGTDVADAIAAVIRSEPAWGVLPATTPAAVRRLLGRCLQKDPRRRLSDIRDARFALEDAETEAPGISTPVAVPNRRARAMWAAVLFAGLAGGAAGAWLASAGAPAPPAPEMRVEVTTPPTTDAASLAISPDGTVLAFVASADGRPMLWVRSLVTGESRPLPGTDGAVAPFWAPDSRAIGFFAASQLWRIDPDGASLRALADAPVPVGGTWSREGVILFNGTPDGPIIRVSDEGGEVARVPGSESARGGERAPRFLPDGRQYLYFRAESDVRGVWVGTLDGPERRRLLDADASAVFVPPARLAFVQGGTLFVQRFDPDRGLLEGEPVRLAEGVAVDPSGAPAVSASSSGTLVFRAGSGSRVRQLVWRDRSGGQIGEAFASDPASGHNPSLSADGRQLAIARNVSGNTDIWISDLTRPGALTRVTTASTPDVYPVWSPDGQRIVYGGRGEQGFDLRQAPTTGAGSDTVLYSSPGVDMPLDWSSDRMFILFATADSSSSTRLMALPVGGDQAPIDIARSRAGGGSGAFSPDGKWVAFESDETGRVDVYLQPFPGPGPKRVISIGGGLQPMWRPDGRELYYVAADGQLTAVALRVGPGATLEPASPVPLFPSRIDNTVTGGMARNYVVSKEGAFLLNQFVEQDLAPVTLILNLGAR